MKNINAEGFKSNIKKAIKLLGDQSTIINDEKLIEVLIQNVIPYKEAIEILIFLPIAFTRRFIPNLNWIDNYYEESEGKKVEKKFSETDSYRIIWDVTNEYFLQNPSNETVLKIAGRSSELNAINVFLNKGGDLNNIKFLPTTFIR